MPKQMIAAQSLSYKRRGYRKGDAIAVDDADVDRMQAAGLVQAKGKPRTKPKPRPKTQTGAKSDDADPETKTENQ
ncbi:MAG: hypothetical protein AAFP69_03465 [Planctomycetota bacterium]